MAEEEFRWAEEEYLSLREQLDAQLMTQEQFDAVVNILIFRDAQGRYWKLGADSGRWYVHNGTRWRQASPYSNKGSRTETGKAPRPREDATFWVLFWSLVLVLLIAGVAAYYFGLVPV